MTDQRASGPDTDGASRRMNAGAADTLAFLADLSQSLAVSLDLRETLPAVVDRIVDFMQVEAASLFLLDDATRVIECKLSVGPVDVVGTRLAIGQGVVGRAVAENATQIVTDAGADARVWRASDESTGFVTRSLVCAPLRTAAGPIGALEIINRRDGRAFTSDDAELLDLVAAPAALAINSARLAATLLAQQRLKREFDLARRMQRLLLPKRRRGGFPVIGSNHPAHEISGDFYDYFDLPDGQIGFVVGDVSGKGLDAAMLMVRAAALLRWIGKDGLPPHEWLARANDELCETQQDGRFVCALVGQCDRAATRVRFAGAGFPPVIVHVKQAFLDYPSGGPPLGILPGMQYASEMVELDGGTLYAFSDGATDVRDADGHPIGNAGVRALLARHAEASTEARLRAVLCELRRMRLVDDTTLLMVEAPRAGTATVLAERTFPAEAGQLRALRVDLRRALDDLAVDPGLRDRLVLAVDEACANIIRHGYGPQRSGDIRFRLLRTDDVLTFELTDSAPCVDPERLRAKPLGECRCGGFGIALIDEVMDEWCVGTPESGKGNRLLLRKRIGGDSEHEDEEA